jgi:hypothetical protein
VDGKRLEIDGCVYDLEDPEERKAAVRAWLRSKSRERRAAPSSEKTPGGKGATNGAGDGGEKGRSS